MVPSMFRPSLPLRHTLTGTLLLSLALSLVACESEPQGPPPPPPEFNFPVDVQVTDGAGQPVHSVAVELDGQVVGFTGADGTFKATLVEKPNTNVTLKVSAPEGYRVADGGEITEALRVTEVIGGQYSGLPLTLKPKVVSLRHTFMGWVQTSCDERMREGSCEGLPVLVDGQEVARTDFTGAAQFSFEGIPGQSAKVSIRTPEYDPNDDDSALFEPRNPEFELALGYTATIFRIDQNFVDPAAKRAAPKRRTTRRTSSRRATRKTTKKKPAKQEEKENHIISIW
ncbi:hypothetical protein DL240_00915 [Lujinxingia litoralis]|uniref:Carboxypeptidase regulatory-like domain-containing protein n=1 Tax=Lujinxingia litoralis TaxID=2211119 RepID=A0A328CDM5_9DELT|nr:carboxypeptidase-like regulatory domain-containing protein [Lujinxingia litoralis]RAL24803.1 hypothetical protein DL240_00915 [Lujinxingia litoralis]